MIAPEMAESVGGVDDLSDDAVDAIALQLRPAKRIRWKKKYLVERKAHTFWCLVSGYLFIALLLCLLALVVAVFTGAPAK
jgi:hypothetical protein